LRERDRRAAGVGCDLARRGVFDDGGPTATGERSPTPSGGTTSNHECLDDLRRCQHPRRERSISPARSTVSSRSR
jgi:hypothetical protein